MWRKVLSIALISCLCMSSVVLSQEAAPNPAPTTAQTSSSSDTSEKKSILDNRSINSPLSREVYKRLGEPGYYFSKFLNFRRNITQPSCTLSEQLSHLATITGIVGEVTTHAFYYFRTKALQKKFSAKMSGISSYEEQRKKDNKKITEYDNKAPDAQLESLKFMRESSKIDLKHAEMVRAFTYTSLGMQITSKIIASNEAIAETASLGSTLASTNACKAAK